MKQALIVDPQGTVEDFARDALGLYEQTLTGSLQEAEALASGADYDLVLIAIPWEICDGALWMMVERIMRLATDAALVLVHAEEADAAFHARAAGLGVAVIRAPLGVTAQALIDEAAG